MMDVLVIMLAFVVSWILPVYIFSQPRSRAAYLAFIAAVIACGEAVIYLALTA